MKAVKWAVQIKEEWSDEGKTREDELESITMNWNLHWSLNPAVPPTSKIEWAAGNVPYFPYGLSNWSKISSSTGRLSEQDCSFITNRWANKFLIKFIAVAVSTASPILFSYHLKILQISPNFILTCSYLFLTPIHSLPHFHATFSVYALIFSLF
jgi:hypothetical protein